jgi:hypothetical protein
MAFFRKKLHGLSRRELETLAFLEREKNAALMMGGSEEKVEKMAEAPKVGPRQKMLFDATPEKKKVWVEVQRELFEMKPQAEKFGKWWISLLTNYQEAIKSGKEKEFLAWFYAAKKAKSAELKLREAQNRTEEKKIAALEREFADASLEEGDRFIEFEKSLGKRDADGKPIKAKQQLSG